MLKFKKLLNLFLGLFPQSLPRGMTEQTQFFEKFFNTYDIPSLDSYKLALATMIMHLKPTEAFKSPFWFYRSVRAAQSKETAYQVIAEDREKRNKEERESKQKAFDLKQALSQQSLQSQPHRWLVTMALPTKKYGRKTTVGLVKAEVNPDKVVKKKFFEKKRFIELNRKWTEKLAMSGFEDIEEPESPRELLKQYHNHYFVTRNKLYQFEDNQRYYELARQLLHTYKFNTKHDRKIWELHADGKKEREIALEVKSTKYKVNRVIKEISKAIKRDAKEILEDLDIGKKTND